MEYTQALRNFWTVPTLEQAKHERVTVPPQPAAWTDEHQSRCVDRWLGDVPLRPGSVILDYGCGVGRMVRPVARRGCHVIAADVSPQMLEFCRDYCAGMGEIEYVLSDGYGVPSLPTESVDGAFSFYVFQHMPCRSMAETVLADLWRVLKRGGWCKIQTVDTRANIPVERVGFHGERQTGAFLFETSRRIGFRSITLHSEAEDEDDVIVLTTRR